MCDDWQLLSLAAADVEVIDCEHKTPPATEDGYPYVMIPQLSKGRLDLTDVRRICKEHFIEWTRKANPRPFDVILSRRCNPGETAMVPQGFEGALGQNLVLLRATGSAIRPHFLRWLVRSPEWWSQVGFYLNTGSVFDSLKCADIPKFTFRVPPPAEQLAIAECLSALDDKIELNRRINETLEAMARSLFKSWFVDFEPVTAKAVGKKPCAMTDDLAALFPNEFVDSYQGPTPKGWSYRPVGEVIEAVFDGPHATPPDSDQGAVFLGIKNMTGTGLNFTETRHISEADWPKWTRRVTPRHGDIVFTYEATLGFFALIPPGLRCCLGRRMALVRPSTETKYPHYLFHWFVSEPFQETIERGATHGSTVNRVPLLDFPKYPVVWPTIQLVEKFEHRASTNWASIHQRQEESHQLIALRDSLLPKLLSGEIRLRDAERKIKEVL